MNQTTEWTGAWANLRLSQGYGYNPGFMRDIRIGSAKAGVGLPLFSTLSLTCTYSYWRGRRSSGSRLWRRSRRWLQETVRSYTRSGM